MFINAVKRTEKFTLFTFQFMLLVNALCWRQQTEQKHSRRRDENSVHSKDKDTAACWREGAQGGLLRIWGGGRAQA